MSAIGFNAVNKMFQNAMPGPIEPWHTFTETEYAAYVELGTSRASAQPYMRTAIEQTMAEFSELAAKAKDTNDLIRLIALRIEYHAKRNCASMFADPTGNLMRSIDAEKL